MRLLFLVLAFISLMGCKEDDAVYHKWMVPPPRAELSANSIKIVIDRGAYWGDSANYVGIFYMFDHEGEILVRGYRTLNQGGAEDSREKALPLKFRKLTKTIPVIWVDPDGEKFPLEVTMKQNE